MRFGGILVFLQEGTSNALGIADQTFVEERSSVGQSYPLGTGGRRLCLIAWTEDQEEQNRGKKRGTNSCKAKRDARHSLNPAPSKYADYQARVFAGLHLRIRFYNCSAFERTLFG